MRAGLGIVAVLGASLGTLPLHAQARLDVSGRVVRASTRGAVALAGATVVLHRIGPSSAGPVDSLVADRSGRFRFRLPSADTNAMYLAAARHAGLAYFAPPARPGVPVTDALIEVFDTTSAAVPLHVTGRHLVVSAPDVEGRRSVVEVYELQNDSVVTRLGSKARPNFVAPVPGAATGVGASQGDYTGDAVAVTAAGVAILAPVAPGVRQLAFNYRLPATAFPLALTVRDSAAVFEVLLEEASGQVVADGMQALGAVTTEGRSFVRFLGRDVPAGRAVQVRLAAPPVTGGSSASWPWLVGMGCAALGAIAWASRPGRPPADAAPPVTALPETVPPGTGGSRADELRAAIASVGALVDAPDTVPASLPSLRAYQEELQGQLDALVAPPSGPP